MKTEKTFYTYFHTRNDTNAVFYVGKGHGKRAHEHGRNPHWNNIVARYGRTVHIAAQWSTESEAFEHEKFLILCFKDLRIPLTNMTNGGEGVCGMDVWTGRKHAPESKVKMSVSATGRRASQETKAKMAIARKTWAHSATAKANMSASAKGKVLSEHHKRLISSTLKGKPVSEETRARLSAAASAQWARKRGE